MCDGENGRPPRSQVSPLVRTRTGLTNKVTKSRSKRLPNYLSLVQPLRFSTMAHVLWIATVIRPNQKKNYIMFLTSALYFLPHRSGETNMR